jgi:predicted alpha/beta superfamily hydrolase
MKTFIVIAALFLWVGCASAQTKSNAGDIPVKTFACNSDILQMDMVLKEYYFHSKNIDDAVKVDISYLNGSEKLPNVPVIYVTDGYWRRSDHKYIHYLTKRKEIPPVIVAAIGYPKNYDYEKTRTRDLTDSPENFRQCILKEVIPFVEEKFSCDPHKRILFGASRGGHFTLYSFFHDAADSNNVFCAYIGASPYLPEKDAAKLYAFEKILSEKTKAIHSRLFLSYGELEGYDFMVGPDEKMFRLLDERNYQGLEFIHHVYPEKNHYTNMRPTMVDGVRLFLADSAHRGIGFKDFQQNSLSYHFKNSAEIYDWDYSLDNKHFAIRSLAFDPVNSSEQDGSGSLKAECRFTGPDSSEAYVGTVFDHGEDFSGKTVSVKVYIPEDLAGMDCTIRTFVFSTENWISDEQKPVELKSGWNDIRWDLSNAQLKGNVKEVRRFGWSILHPDGKPLWNGNIYYDEIHW